MSPDAERAVLSGLIPAEHQPNVFKFMLMFSRFECALKNAGYLREGPNGSAEPEWDKFGSDNSDAFFAITSADLDQAEAYLKGNPPRTQTVDGGKLSWGHVPFGANHLTSYLVCVRRVRNNLFHGGKFPFSTYMGTDPARDPDLIRHCTTILSHCVNLNAGVLAAFRAQG